MSNKYYITTPIYYVTDAPHIGHLYTTTGTDIMARYQRMSGKEVYFLTGTDEHGQKIQKKAKENGESPQELADRVVERYKVAWEKYEITNDDFIRTTEPRHKKVVVEYMKRLMETGDIYLSEYEGLYCVSDEAYYTESQLVDGKSPISGNPVTQLKEESYFFKMSAYSDRLLKHIEENPDFIVPESRKNEVVSFIKQGLRDISVSRTTISWGVPMPENAQAKEEHKVYVWFDALTNYISALKPLDEDNQLFKEFWPEAIHVVGKDILRFHAVYWPTFLMALGLPLPKQIVAHGWLTDSNRKISKSLGNAIDPMKLADVVGVDALRYFLFREFVFGQDGEYTQDTVYKRINADLANDFGNALSRVCAMIGKYLGSDPIEVKESLNSESLVKDCVNENLPKYHQYISQFVFHKALESAWNILSAVNRYIEAQAPWKLAKSDEQSDIDKLKSVLLHCHEALRCVSILAIPVMPLSAKTALERLGDTESLNSKTPFQCAQWGEGPNRVSPTKGEALFPRLEAPESK